MLHSPWHQIWQDRRHLWTCWPRALETCKPTLYPTQNLALDPVAASGRYTEENNGIRWLWCVYWSAVRRSGTGYIAQTWAGRPECTCHIDLRDNWPRSWPRNQLHLSSNQLFPSCASWCLCPNTGRRGQTTKDTTLVRSCPSITYAGTLMLFLPSP